MKTMMTSLFCVVGAWFLLLFLPVLWMCGVVYDLLDRDGGVRDKE